MKFTIVNIEFDTSTDDTDEEEQRAVAEDLAAAWEGKTVEAEDEDELLDRVSDTSGWCINFVHLREA